MSDEQVILVDEYDNEIGYQEKIKAHELAQLHRAFSVFIVHQDEHGQWWTLLQQRQHSKYHCGGLWTNSCCSHPRPGESILEAASRRVYEELGVDLPQMTRLDSFIYTSHFTNGLTENEFDHVVLAETRRDLLLAPNIAEVAMTRWLTIDAAIAEQQARPDSYTPWFSLALTIVMNYIKQKSPKTEVISS